MLARDPRQRGDPHLPHGHSGASARGPCGTRFWEPSIQGGGPKPSPGGPSRSPRDPLRRGGEGQWRGRRQLPGGIASHDRHPHRHTPGADLPAPPGAGGVDGRMGRRLRRPGAHPGLDGALPHHAAPPGADPERMAGDGPAPRARPCSRRHVPVVVRPSSSTWPTRCPASSPRPLASPPETCSRTTLRTLLTAVEAGSVGMAIFMALLYLVYGFFVLYVLVQMILRLALIDLLLGPGPHRVGAVDSAPHGGLGTALAQAVHDDGVPAGGAAHRPGVGLRGSCTSSRA